MFAVENPLSVTDQEIISALEKAKQLSQSSGEFDVKELVGKLSHPTTGSIETLFLIIYLIENGYLEAAYPGEPACRNTLALAQTSEQLIHLNQLTKVQDKMNEKLFSQNILSLLNLK